MIGAAFLLGMNGRQAVKTYRRDRYKHKSPNSAHTEAVCAGALGIRLAGPASYFGKMVEKPISATPCARWRMRTSCGRTGCCRERIFWRRLCLRRRD